MPRVIITVQDKNPQPYRFKLGRKVVSLGRGSDNDIVIDSGSVSGKHAEMRRVEGGYELADLGSTNGIKHNGERHQVISLRSGMSLKLGDVVFDFTLAEDELEALGHEKPAQGSPITEEEMAAPEQELSEEDAPAGRAATRRSSAPPERESAGVSMGMIFLFLLLAAGAFYAGMDIRHRKETGETIIHGIVNKAEVQETAPEKIAVPDDADAE